MNGCSNVLKSKFSSAEIKLFLILIECSLFFYLNKANHEY